MKLAIFCCVLLVACSAVEVTKPTTSKYAPVGYRPKGMVKYLNNGADFVIKERRESAFKTMYESCGGKYRIINESDIPSDEVERGGYKYWYITYECEG